MARNVKKLPKWAIKQAGGINKKAWALARGKRRAARTPRKKATRSRTRSASRSAHGSHRVGLVGKLNGFLRGLKLGLPAIGSVQAHGITSRTPANIIWRYSGYNMESQEFDVETVKTAAGFYAGNVIEAKTMGALRIPQMAGKKKLLSVVANFLPEIQAVPDLVKGDFQRATDLYGQASIGYNPSTNEGFITSSFVRDSWIKTLGARVGLGLISRFAGPMINRHLPKGVNI